MNITKIAQPIQLYQNKLAYSVGVHMGSVQFHGPDRDQISGMIAGTMSERPIWSDFCTDNKFTVIYLAGFFISSVTKFKLFLYKEEEKNLTLPQK